MRFSVNAGLFGDMTAIPSEIVDKHLKLASGTQLKVILAFLRNSQSEDAIELIMKKLGLSETEVLEALEYWAGCHVLIDNEHEQPQPIQTEKAPVKQIEVTAKPTREEAIRRMSESTELQFLFSEVQNRLGRLITQAEMATLVWLHDHQGLPVPVILMSIEYAMNQEKVSFSYIEKTCIDWANNDINTLEKAEQRINALFLSKTAWKIVESAFGIPHRKPSAREEKYADTWVNQYAFQKDMLILAYNICIDATSKLSFAYINKILEKWHKAGYQKPEDVEAAEQKQQEKKAKKQSSYDMNKIRAKFNNFDD